MRAALRNACSYGIGVALALTSLGIAAQAVAANAPANNDASYSLREVEVFDDFDLTEARLTCALGKMPEVLRKTKASKLVKTAMPDADIYCLKVVSVTAAKQRGADLYIRLAIMEQGFTDFVNSGQSKYLAHDEPARTMAAVLHAANAGQISYAGIAGHTHDLPCALALDAGATWAETAANASPPVAFTADEAAVVAHQCYDPSVTQITVHGTAMPATKAGLVVGAWFGRQ